MFSLYIHIPFCVDRCTYCDFYSTKMDEAQVLPYLDALELELSRRIQGKSVDTIYIGGGTPTALPLPALERLLQWLNKNIELKTAGEFTVEANPGTVNTELCDVLLGAGVNRISMGAQSFQPDILKNMRRVHQAETTVQALECLRAAGCDNINLDLIFAYPGQTLEMLQDDLECFHALAPEHLSAYALTFYEKTYLSTQLQLGKVQEPAEDEYVQMYELLLDRMAAWNYEHYEISNFAKPGYHSRHNCATWDYESYCGVGVSAWSFEAGRRFGNVRNMREYQSLIQAGDSACVESETLDGEQRIAEIAIMKLRQLSGVNRQWWTAKTGRDLAELAERLKKHIDSGHLLWDNETLRLGRNGLLVSNAILADCLAE